MTKKMKKAEKTSPSSMLENRGMVFGIIIVAVIVTAAVTMLIMGNGGDENSLVPNNTMNTVPPDECAADAISYVNANLASAGSNVTFVSVSERNGVYLIEGNYQNQNVYFYATEDCHFLFTRGYDLSQPVATPTPSPTPTSPPEPMKTARPSVELFVMSFCPYGVQAENAMEPVVDLLGQKADINVRFIARVQGDSVDSVSSLHGPPEAKEDLRQLCVMDRYPDKFWEYLMLINEECYPVWRDATQLESCQQNVTTSLGMTGIDACAGGTEGLALLRADETITKGYGVTGSPTLMINGQKYSGQRTPEAFKQAICDRFETPPEECEVDLSGNTVAASTGSC